MANHSLSDQNNWNQSSLTERQKGAPSASKIKTWEDGWKEGLHSAKEWRGRRRSWKVNESEKWELISRIRKSIGGAPRRADAEGEKNHLKIWLIMPRAAGPRPVTGKVTRQVATLPLSEKGAATVFTFSKFNFWLGRGETKRDNFLPRSRLLVSFGFSFGKFARETAKLDWV